MTSYYSSASYLNTANTMRGCNRPLQVQRRSSPIAINSTKNKNDFDRRIRIKSSFSSSEDEDDNNNDIDVLNDSIANFNLSNNNNTTNYIGSLPIQRGKKNSSFSSSSWTHKNIQRKQKSLPGAPLLSSKKDGDGNLFDESGGPPPMQLTDHVESHLTLIDHPNNNDSGGLSTSAVSTPYGSLRESHLEGKFMDGPASYRDKSSGQIHLLKYNTKDTRLFVPSNNNKNNNNSQSYTENYNNNNQQMFLLPPKDLLQKQKEETTPGERMNNNNNNATTTSTKFKQSSFLSTMMQDATPQQQQQYQPQQYRPPTACSSMVNNDDETSNNTMLSTSLTGIEILRAARQRPELLHMMNNTTPSSLPLSGGGGIQNIEPPTFLPPYDFQDDDDDDEEENVFELDME